jgi:S1-C subfamily serine protease
MAILIALVAGAVTAQFVLSHQPAAPSASNASSTLTAASASSGTAQTAMAATAIYRAASKGVVTITTQSGGFRGGQGTGSGIVLDKSGDILTANHVINNANQVQVTFSNGQTVNAGVVNTDAAHDLATIKVSVSASSLSPLPMGNSNNVLVGDTVYAIGAPFGHPESMSSGIVSGLNRSDPNSGLTGLIQTDARTNPGNSGGPLLNTLGQVIGVNVAIESPVQGSVGVGFAVPINSFRPSEGGNL